MSRVNGHRLYFAPMVEADLPQVVAIDEQSFPISWGEISFRYELTQNQTAHFIVAVDTASEQRGWLARLLHRPPARTIVGYAGFWLVLDEAHIGTLAIHPHWRGHGLGEQLLIALLQRAIERGAVTVHLEVRVGNTVAQSLYRKYGFEAVGRRKQYYRDNKEDAFLMTAQMDEAYRQRVREKFSALQDLERVT
jgi:ribosomal-protein-alanine N-acetyltransferase